MKIGFIGLGNMATAMIGGIIRNKIVDAKDIIGSAHTSESVKKAVDTYGITGAPDNETVAKGADYLVLAVKPQMYPSIIEEIRHKGKKGAVIISIAPGKTVKWLSELFLAGKDDEGEEIKIVRCMPNTPALVGEGCTGVYISDTVSLEEKDFVLDLLNSFGKAIEVPEHLMDAVVGVSGSSPAYVFMLIEAMADAAVSDGIPRKQAYEFAAQSVMGSAKMVLETKKHPAELKDMVCSPGGTTIEAVRILEKSSFRSSVIEAQKACVSKSKSM